VRVVHSQRARKKGKEGSGGDGAATFIVAQRGGRGGRPGGEGCHGASQGGQRQVVAGGWQRPGASVQRRHTIARTGEGRGHQQVGPGQQ
jgi:hypothetical protein